VRKQSKKVVKSKVDNKTGRKSEDNTKLWARRVEELYLYSARVSIYTICQKYGISRQTLYEDLKALSELKDPLLAKQKILSGIDLIINKGLAQGDLKVALDALELEGKIEGLLRGDNINILQQNLGGIGPIVKEEKNPYDEWGEDELIKEFERRRNRFGQKSVKPSEEDKEEK